MVLVTAVLAQLVNAGCSWQFERVTPVAPRHHQAQRLSGERLAAAALIHHTQLRGILLALQLARVDFDEHAHVEVDAHREHWDDVTTVTCCVRGDVLQHYPQTL